MLPFFIIGKSWLSPEQIVVANLGKDPLISMVVSSWGKQRVIVFLWIKMGGRFGATSAAQPNSAWPHFRPKM